MGLYSLLSSAADLCFLFHLISHFFKTHLHVLTFLVFTFLLFTVFFSLLWLFRSCQIILQTNSFQVSFLTCPIKPVKKSFLLLLLVGMIS